MNSKRPGGLSAAGSCSSDQLRAAQRANHVGCTFYKCSPLVQSHGCFTGSPPFLKGCPSRRERDHSPPSSFPLGRPQGLTARPAHAGRSSRQGRIVVREGFSSVIDDHPTAIPELSRIASGRQQENLQMVMRRWRHRAITVVGVPQRPATNRPRSIRRERLRRQSR